MGFGILEPLGKKAERVIEALRQGDRVLIAGLVFGCRGCGGCRRCKLSHTLSYHARIVPANPCFSVAMSRRRERLSVLALEVGLG
jgi:D-arabinose 1-dehydrogenase-like Zn-dependent alcohol dehydrogenase